MSHPPNESQALIDQGTGFLKSGHYDEAEAVFLEAQIKWPDNPLPYIGAARAAQFNNKLKLSLKRWKLAKALFPNNLHILKGLGNLYMEFKKFTEANRCFREIHQLETSYIAEMEKFIGNINTMIVAEEFTEDIEEFTKAENLCLEAQTRWPDNIAPFHRHHRLLEIKRRKSK